MLMAYCIPQFFGRKLVTGENGNNTNGIVLFTGILQMNQSEEVGRKVVASDHQTTLLYNEYNNYR